MRTVTLISASLFSIRLLALSTASADESLHQRIDQAIAAAHQGPTAQQSSDAEFLRRVWLDLAGTIPTADEARIFLDDKAADKRIKLVDRLLASPDYAERMQQAFTVMLLERRAGKTIADEKWEEYLRQSFAANKPLDQLVRELLSADGTEPATRPAMKFFLARSASDHKLLARDMSRLLLGRNLECAQCHDHPSIKDYKQSEFYGLVAFLQDSYLYQDKKTKTAFFAEKGLGTRIEFTSVFTNESGKTGPRLVGGKEIDVPTFEKGQELEQPATEGKPPIAKFPLRPQLASSLAALDNRSFARNMANRLWAMMMGRGLVHPLDMLHPDNPASHPKLLETLTDELVSREFDAKSLLRDLALSQTYQRSSHLGEGVDQVPAESFAVFNMKSLSAEQLTLSLLRATGNLKHVLAQPADKEATAKYRPDKGRPIPSVNLDNVMKLFRSVYAGQPGQSEEGFNPSLAATLFVANEPLLLQWLSPRDNNLMARLKKIESADAVAEQLYLSILSRRPNDQQRNAVAAYLEANPKDHTAALGEMTWALLASSEFRLNH